MLVDKMIQKIHCLFMLVHSALTNVNKCLIWIMY